MQNYLIFYYSEWEMDSPYYFVTRISGKSPQEALDSNLALIIQATRISLRLDDEIDDDRIAEQFYVVPEDHWMSSREAYRQAEIA